MDRSWPLAVKVLGGSSHIGFKCFISGSLWLLPWTFGSVSSSKLSG
jgi:hypothetical protein